MTKITISTKFWEQVELQTWRDRFEYFNLIILFFTVSNFTYYLFSNRYFMMTLNLFLLLLQAIIWYSRSTYKKQGDNNRIQ